MAAHDISIVRYWHYECALFGIFLLQKWGYPQYSHTYAMEVITLEANGYL